ncbi:hypothetical protein L1887_50443 [Cichorium endivia]|nr:hypothetical protein L1887_50443 [Cichorium endivia]
MAARTTQSVARAWPTTRAFGGRGPYCWSAKQAAGTRVASSPDSDLEAFSHNPAHGSFAPLAFQPSAMTNCANQRSKGSLGHAFTVRIRTGNQNQTSFYPSVPHEISVLLAVRRPGKAPEGAVPSPSPGRHAATRSRRGSSSSSPPTADGFGTGTPVPSPQSQSFSRGYGSILPTSLAYIVPSTRGCSPWRPDAVMSTTGRGRHSVLRIFKGRRGRTGHRATCGALPAAGPYLRLSLPFTWNLSPLRPSKFSFEYLLLPPRSAPTAAPPRLTPKVSAQFGTVTRLPVHPASPVLLTKNGPLGALDSVARLNEAAAPSYLFKNSHPGSSYPEGNFGGNQLLDGSISLSPLYPSQTNDLHVSIAAGLHQSFLWLRPAQA